MRVLKQMIVFALKPWINIELILGKNLFVVFPLMKSFKCVSTNDEDKFMLRKFFFARRGPGSWGIATFFLPRGG